MGFNPYKFADEVSGSLLGSISTWTAGGTTLNTWTNTTSHLTKQWTTDNDYFTDISNPPGVNIRTGFASLADLKAFISQYMTKGGQTYIYDFSEMDIQYLLNDLDDPSIWPTDGSGSVIAGQIQQFGQAVQSTEQIETSIGDTQTKSQASFIQQEISAPQIFSDMENAVLGVGSTIASLLMQSFL